MSDNKVTLDQLDNSAVEAMSSSVGDVSMLNTENKTIVGALAEIVGKKEIANAIGEPLAETDKFTEMSSEINGLLSTFKTNMMNAGVVVESGDKFKALIDKIQGLTEGEGNKGVQYVEGIVTRDITHSKNFNDIDGYSSSGTSYIVLPKLNFEPTLLIAMSNNPSDYYPVVSLISYDYNFNALSAKSALFSGSVYDGLSYNFKADELVFLEDSIHLPVYNGEAITFNWYAIGVGEEDTTLRDSLASILTDEGVEVTEEDDMASLISKVDEEFDRKNIQEYQFDANQEGYPVNILSYTNKITSSSTTWTIFKQETLPLSGIFKCTTVLTKLGTSATPVSVRLGVVDTDGVETFYDTFSQSSTNGTTTANWIINIQQNSTINFYGMVESSANTLSISNVNISTNIVCN